MKEDLEDKLMEFADTINGFSTILAGDTESLEREIDLLTKVDKECCNKTISGWKEEIVSENQQLETVDLLCQSVDSLKGFLILRKRVLAMRKKIIAMTSQLSPEIIKEIEEVMRKEEK